MQGFTANEETLKSLIISVSYRNSNFSNCLVLLTILCIQTQINSGSYASCLMFHPLLKSRVNEQTAHVLLKKIKCPLHWLCLINPTYEKKYFFLLYKEITLTRWLTYKCILKALSCSIRVFQDKEYFFPFKYYKLPNIHLFRGHIKK